MSGDTECQDREKPKADEVDDAAENQCDEFLIASWKPMEAHNVKENASQCASKRDDHKWQCHPEFVRVSIGNDQKDQQSAWDNCSQKGGEEKGLGI